MSEENNRDEARVYIKKLVDFNFKNDYYQKDKKEELARAIKKLLFVDDPTVRQFLDQWILATKSVAREFDLIGTDAEVVHADEEQTPEEEEQEKSQDEEEEHKEPTEQPAEEQTAEEAPTEEKASAAPIPKLPEGYVYENVTVKRASQLVDDLLEE